MIYIFKIVANIKSPTMLKDCWHLRYPPKSRNEDVCLSMREAIKKPFLLRRNGWKRIITN